MHNPKASNNEHPVFKSKFSILLVEDSADDAFFFKRILKKAGFVGHLEHATDGRAAIRYLAASEKYPPALVFLDLKMPIMSGFEVLGWMGEKEFCRNLRTVVLSGSDDNSDRERAARLGAADYLVKPIEIETLRKQLNIVDTNLRATSP